jgi:regulator of sigma E protease
VTWLIIIAGFIVLIVLHEAGHFTAAKAVGMRVERFALFFPPLIVKKKIGETEYGIGAIPAGGYVKISGMNPAEDLPDEVRTRAYYSQPVWKRIVVVAAGPFVNIVIAFVVLLIFWGALGAPQVNNRVGSVMKGFPAYGALQKGDQIISVDGQSGGPAEISKLISSNKCAENKRTKGCLARDVNHLLVERDGKIIDVAVRPKYDPVSKRMLVGFSYGIEHHSEGLGAALKDSANDFWLVARQTASLPARIFNAHERKQISGVVGVSDVAHTTIQTDAALAVRLLAIVSLSLAIVNLFPFLPLDGGHIFWAVVELFRRRPVPYSVMERAGVVGFMLVIALFFIGLTNDIGRINSGGF